MKKVQSKNNSLSCKTSALLQISQDTVAQIQETLFRYMGESCREQSIRIEIQFPQHWDIDDFDDDPVEIEIENDKTVIRSKASFESILETGRILNLPLLNKQSRKYED